MPIYGGWEASAKTYAASMPKATIVGLPGSEALRYQRGNLNYVDCYYPGSNDFADCEGYEEIYERQTSKWLFRRDYKGLLL